jgi:hypothetical protein
MTLLSEHHHFRPADDRFADIPSPTADLFADVFATSCRRLGTMRRTAAVTHLDRLIESAAWTDAALALLAIELPQWRLRRLAYDNGEWHCALSSQREMPEWLDQSVEAHHSDMALAILCAVVEAIADNAPVPHASVPAVPAPRDGFEPVLCDHFA